MNNRFTFSVKEVIYLSLSLIAIGVILTYSIFMAYEFAKSGKDWISAVIGFAGNVLGGLIGGVVAYLVAAYQVRKTIELEGNKSFSSSYALLRLIKSELMNNRKIIDSGKTEFSSGQNLSFLPSLSIDNWLRCSDRLGIEVTDETINKMQTCYTKIAAYRNTQAAIPLPASESIIQTIDGAMSLIENDIQAMQK